MHPDQSVATQKDLYLQTCLIIVLSYDPLPPSAEILLAQPIQSSKHEADLPVIKPESNNLETWVHEIVPCVMMLVRHHSDSSSFTSNHDMHPDQSVT